MPAPRTVVTFQSEAFNTSVIRPYFLNANCFGDDLAQHLACEMERKGYPCSQPAQEDFGWYFRFQAAGIPHLFLVGRRPVEADWLGSLERVPTLFFPRNVAAEASLAVHAVLCGSPLFAAVRWHFAKDFDVGNEDLGATAP
jgi:hypothetical protein